MWHDPATVEWMELDIYRLSRVGMAFDLKVAKISGVGQPRSSKMDNWQRTSQGRCQDGKGVYEVEGEPAALGKRS